MYEAMTQGALIGRLQITFCGAPGEQIAKPALVDILIGATQISLINILFLHCHCLLQGSDKIVTLSTRYSVILPRTLAVFGSLSSGFGSLMVL